MNKESLLTTKSRATHAITTTRYNCYITLLSLLVFVLATTELSESFLLSTPTPLSPTKYRRRFHSSIIETFDRPIPTNMCQSSKETNHGSTDGVDATIISQSLLFSRLIQAGVSSTSISIQRDEDWDHLERIIGKESSDESVEEKKEEESFVDNDAAGQLQSSTDPPSESQVVVEVKTLIWEVSYKQLQHHHHHQQQQDDDDNAAAETFYIVTGLRMEDRVDMPLLRKLILSQYDHLRMQSNSIRISLAPKEIAESMTGYQSGCMPPICHTEPMQLFVESSILSETKSNGISRVSTLISIGSGILGHSLLLPVDDFAMVSERTSFRYQNGTFALSSSSSTRRAVSDELPTTNRDKKIRDSTQQKRVWDQRKDRIAEYRSFSKITDKAKLLRTTARKKGRYEEMKLLVEEALQTGDFPSLFTVRPEEGLDKNSLHLSAWRGDLETVQLLVETARKHYPD